MDLRDRRVVVLGLGISGIAAARLARRRGAHVVACDTRPGRTLDDLPVHAGPFDPAITTTADVLVVSPGVAAAEPAVVAAQQAGVDVVGELGFALRQLHVPWVGITGTNGKSTVTRWTGTLLGAPAALVFVGGNLGTPVSDAVGGPFSQLVVEVSSYQLELPGGRPPHVAALLNLTPDHLARHGTLEVYAATKARLLAGQGPEDLAFLPVDGAFDDVAAGVGQGRRRRIGGRPGVWRTGRTVHVSDGDVEFDLSDVAVVGDFNLDHAATAAALALAMGASPDDVQARLPTLRPLPHRLQPVGEVGGVRFIDDSKATNVASTAAAVRGLQASAVVLLGGQAKDGDDFGVLAPSLARHRAIVCFGADGPEIAAALARHGRATHERATLDEAVALARDLARPGDVVLLSPGCASFDAFDDFAHRGRVFADLVHAPPVRTEVP